MLCEFAVVEFALRGTRPIGRIDATRHITVECGIRPIRRSLDHPMLDRIDMAIVDVCRIVPIVSEGVFPKPTLPDSAFTLRDADSRPSFGSRQGLDKANLDGFPAIGEIVIAWRQRPHAMEMIGKHHQRIDMERALLPCPAHRLPQRMDVANQQIPPPFQQIDSEELRAARHPITTIIRHDKSVGRNRLFGFRQTASKQPTMPVFIAQRQAGRASHSPVAHASEPEKTVPTYAG